MTGSKDEKGVAPQGNEWEGLPYRLALRSVTAFVSHELNHPLGTISNLATLLERRIHEPVVRPSEMATHFEAIKLEIRRAADVIKQLRILAGNMGGHVEPINCRNFLKEAVSRFRRRYSPAAVSIRVECRNRDLAVAAAGDLLHIGLYNLMVNAVEAMQDAHVETPRVILRAQAVGNQVSIEVIDAGPGVPEGLAGRLFEPFVSGRQGGSGLGLAIVRDIAEWHGGKVMLEDGGGKAGCRFRLVLPAATKTNQEGG